MVEQIRLSTEDRSFGSALGDRKTCLYLSRQFDDIVERARRLLLETHHLGFRMSLRGVAIRMATSEEE